MSEARKISDAEQRKAQSQALDKSVCLVPHIRAAPGPPRSPEAEPSLACLRVQLHTLLGNDVYKTYRAEAAARHKEAAAKHQQQQGTAAPGTPSAPQASAPSQVSAHPAALSMHTHHITLGMCAPRDRRGRRLPRPRLLPRSTKSTKRRARARARRRRLLETERPRILPKLRSRRRRRNRPARRPPLSSVEARAGRSSLESGTGPPARALLAPFVCFSLLSGCCESGTAVHAHSSC